MLYRVPAEGAQKPPREPQRARKHGKYLLAHLIFGPTLHYGNWIEAAEVGHERRCHFASQDVEHLRRGKLGRSQRFCDASVVIVLQLACDEEFSQGGPNRGAALNVGNERSHQLLHSWAWIDHTEGEVGTEREQQVAKQGRYTNAIRCCGRANAGGDCIGPAS